MNMVSLRTFLLTDGDYNVHSPHIWPFDTDVDGDGLDDTMRALSVITDYNFGMPIRHMNGANYLYRDGHAAWVSMRDWELNKSEMWGTPTPY